MTTDMMNLRDLVEKTPDADLLREMIGLPSKRLKEQKEIGIVRVVPTVRKGVSECHLTEAGEDLRPLVFAMGSWSTHWLSSRRASQNLDPTLLMWDIRHGINPAPFPAGRSTVPFDYTELPASQHRTGSSSKVARSMSAGSIPASMSICGFPARCA